MYCTHNYFNCIHNYTLLSVSAQTYWINLARTHARKHVYSVGTATRYELDGPGFEARWGRDIPYPSRPALVHSQLPVQWKPDLSP